jgi:hypothetical protein
MSAPNRTVGDWTRSGQVIRRDTFHSLPDPVAIRTSSRPDVAGPVGTCHTWPQNVGVLPRVARARAKSSMYVGVSGRSGLPK